MPLKPPENCYLAGALRRGDIDKQITNNCAGLSARGAKNLAAHAPSAIEQGGNGKKGRDKAFGNAADGPEAA